MELTAAYQTDPSPRLPSPLGLTIAFAKGYRVRKSPVGLPLASAHPGTAVASEHCFISTLLGLVVSFRPVSAPCILRPLLSSFIRAHGSS